MNTGHDDHLLNSETLLGWALAVPGLRPTGLLGARPGAPSCPTEACLAMHTWETGELRLGHLPKASQLGHISQTSFQAVLLLTAIFKWVWEEKTPNRTEGPSPRLARRHTQPTSQGPRAVFRRVLPAQGPGRTDRARLCFLRRDSIGSLCSWPSGLPGLGATRGLSHKKGATWLRLLFLAFQSSKYLQRTKIKAILLYVLLVI